MTRGDPARTIHFVVAHALERWMGRNEPRRPGMAREDLLDAMISDDPERRKFYATMVAGGWVAPAFALLIAMLVVGIPIDIADDRAGDYAIAACFALGLFCWAGAANAAWRMHWYVPQARRRLAKHGPDSETFARSMRRTLPRNLSLVFQAAVAVLAFVLSVSPE